MAALYCLATVLNLLGMWIISFSDDENLPYGCAFIPVVNILTAALAVLIIIFSVLMLPILLKLRKERIQEKKLNETVSKTRLFFYSLRQLSITKMRWHPAYSQRLARDHLPEFKD